MNQFDVLVAWFTPNCADRDEHERSQHRLLVSASLITSAFALLYMVVSYGIRFHIGIRLELACFVLLYAVLILFRARGQYRLCANLYLANCYLVSILGCSFFSGGSHSMVTPWFALVPIVGVLLLGARMDTWLWSLLAFATPLFYGAAAMAGFDFPQHYDLAFTREFSAICLAGLVLILFGIAVGFNRIVSQARLEIHQQNATLREALSLEQGLRIELEAAQTTVKSLSGLLPICASCKKIRDESEEWQPMERYISTHSEADFTHGYCPDCADALRAEFDRIES